MTKWIEIKPAAAARSAHSPTRPTWPELRSEIAERPVAFAFSTPMSTAIGAIVWPKPKRPSTTPIDRRVDNALDRLVGNEVARAHPVDVARHADHAVAVVAGEIGVDQRGGDARRLLGPAADASENLGAEVGQRVGGNMYCHFIAFV